MKSNLPSSNEFQNPYRDRTTLFFLLNSLFFPVILAGPLPAAEDDSALPDAFRPKQLLWEIRLGTHQYTIPRIDDGQIFLGFNDLNLKHPAVKRNGGGLIMCLEQATGKMLWQLPVPRYKEGTKPPFHFNHWRIGVCSRPALEGKYLYVVSSRGDVLCLDRRGQADGNDGPFLRETDYIGVAPDRSYRLTPADGDIIWRYDMIKQLNVVPHDVCGSSPLLHGEFLYVCTSNGQDNTHKNVANPLAPSLIVLDKKTGRLVAADAERIGQRMFHGHWSSPITVVVDGKTLILFGGGDGVLYAFEPVDPTVSHDRPGALQKIWQADCNPPDYRIRDGRPLPYSSWNRKSPDGPSEIIATPVVSQNRIYLAIGQSPIHGPGRGLLSCLDAATGRKIWESRRLDRSLSDAALHNGLLYIADMSGRLHCFEADSGEHLWQHDLEAGVWSASPLVVSGNVYISTEKNILWILKTGRDKKVLVRSRLKSMAITPTVHDNVFYFATQKRLFALKIPPTASPFQTTVINGSQ